MLAISKVCTMINKKVINFSECQKTLKAASDIFFSLGIGKLLAHQEGDTGAAYCISVLFLCERSEINGGEDHRLQLWY